MNFCVLKETRSFGCGMEVMWLRLYLALEWKTNCELERGRRTIIVEGTTIVQVRVNGAGTCLGKCGCILAACFNFYFLPSHAACGILVPQSVILHVPPVLEAQSVNDWTTREVPSCMFLEEAARFCKVGGEGMKRRYQR